LGSILAPKKKKKKIKNFKACEGALCRVQPLLLPNFSQEPVSVFPVPGLLNKAGRNHINVLLSFFEKVYDLILPRPSLLIHIPSFTVNALTALIMAAGKPGLPTLSAVDLVSVKLSYRNSLNSSSTL
jgi:hypothetical protein